MADVIARFRAWMKEEPKTPCMTDVPDGPLSALLDVAESAQAALPALERMDTLRHIAPEFDELDNLRAALARLEPKRD